MREHYLRVGVGEALFELALGLDTSILHVLKVLAHVLHLILQIGQVAIFTLFALNHL